MRPIRGAARAMLSAVFVLSGARAIANPDPLVPRARRVTDRIEPWLRKIAPTAPTDARTLVQINGAAQLLGGVMLATGLASRPAALLLAGSVVPTTLAGHPYWSFTDAEERRMHQIHFLKNVGLLGGLLLAAVDTQGRPSLRWRANHAITKGTRSVRRAVRSVRRDARIAVRSAAAARRLPM
ncbi:MAG TPA: DoxX family protein [Micromonospora sp.]